jgi:hypothetical protein
MILESSVLAFLQCNIIYTYILMTHLSLFS